MKVGIKTFSVETGSGSCETWLLWPAKLICVYVCVGHFSTTWYTGIWLRVVNKSQIFFSHAVAFKGEINLFFLALMENINGYTWHFLILIWIENKYWSIGCVFYCLQNDIAHNGWWNQMLQNQFALDGNKARGLHQDGGNLYEHVK